MKERACATRLLHVSEEEDAKRKKKNQKKNPAKSKPLKETQAKKQGIPLTVIPNETVQAKTGASC